VLNDLSINAVEWWTQETGSDYRSIAGCKKTAINVTAIKKY
jgi:hypothetical protein